MVMHHQPGRFTFYDTESGRRVYEAAYVQFVDDIEQGPDDGIAAVITEIRVFEHSSQRDDFNVLANLITKDI